MTGAGELVILANRRAAGLPNVGGGSQLAAAAREAGFQPRIIHTSGPRHLQRMLTEHVLGRVDRVAVAGGDGTVHAAIQVLARSDVALGIVPRGTANNFAAALRLPADMRSAFRVIAEGQRRTVDLGRANDVYFAEAAGVGIFADLLAASRARHRLPDALRSIAMLAGAWIMNRPRRLTLTVDGERHTEDVLNVTIANTFSFGYNLPIAPTARVTDAQLDVVVVEALDRREMLAYYRAIQARSHVDLPKVTVRRAREVRIEARHRSIVHIDDRARWRTPVTATVQPGVLAVMVDPPKE